MDTETLGKKQVQKLFEAALDAGRHFLPSDSCFAEKHYRVSDLAELWGLGRETVRKLIKDEPGIIKIRQGRKKANTTYSVPESTARRIHTRPLNVA